MVNTSFHTLVSFSCKMPFSKDLAGSDSLIPLYANAILIFCELSIYLPSDKRIHRLQGYVKPAGSEDYVQQMVEGQQLAE